MAKNDNKKEFVYLIGDFSKATVFVGGGTFSLFGQKSIDRAEFEKPVHDVPCKDKIYRFWNAPDHLREALQERPNTYVFAGDLSKQAFHIDHSGIEVHPLPEMK